MMHYKPQKPVIPTEAPTTLLPTPTTTLPTTTVFSITDFPEEFTTEMELLNRLRKRSLKQEIDYVAPYDGSLDINSNYTGFVEIVGEWKYFHCVCCSWKKLNVPIKSWIIFHISVYGRHEGETLTAYSNYFSILNPGPQVLEAPSTQVLGIVIQILCALILVVLLLLMALCVLHRYTKQVAHAQGIEMITFRNSFRYKMHSNFLLILLHFYSRKYE